MIFTITLYRHRMPKEEIVVEADLVSTNGNRIVFYTNDQTEAIHGLAHRSGGNDVYICQEFLLAEHDTYSVRRKL